MQIKKQIGKPLKAINGFFKTKGKPKKSVKGKAFALALSSGNAKGLAHIGVIQVLEESKIPIKAVVGTSIGALIGGIYAAGKLGEFVNKALKMNRREILSFFITRPTKSGLIEKVKIMNFLSQFLDDERIENLKMKYVAIATDLLNNKKVVIDKGSLMEAISASTSIPGLFPPVIKKDAILMDGGLVDPLPVDVAKKFGKTIAVTLESSKSHFKMPPSIIEILSHSSQVIEKQLLKFSGKPNVLIRPNVEDIGPFHYFKIREAIKAGREAAYKALPKIKKFLK